MNEKLRNRIIRYSFVLTVFVIWLHAGEPLISSIPGQIAVPGFFMLSGFLFFRIPSVKTGTDRENTTAGCRRVTGGETSIQETASSGETWICRIPVWIREKQKRRVSSLLVPYLLWNLIYFLIYLAAGKAELTEFFAAVFHYSCNPVFWYLFQLILITLLAPFVWWMLKRKGTALLWLILLFLAAVFYAPIHRLIPVDLLNADALFYYSLGGFSALYVYEENRTGKKEVCIIADNSAVPAAGSVSEQESGKEREPEGKKSFCGWKEFLTAAAALLVFEALSVLLPAELLNISVIGVRVSGAAALWFLLKLLPELPVKGWMRINFFVYATHYMVIRAVWAAEMALGLNGLAAANIITYLLMPGFCFGSAWLLYNIMKKFTPKLLKLLTGGRG